MALELKFKQKELERNADHLPFASHGTGRGLVIRDTVGRIMEVLLLHLCGRTGHGSGFTADLTPVRGFIGVRHDMPVVVKRVVRRVRTVTACQQFNAITFGVISAVLLIVLKTCEECVTRLAGVDAGGHRLADRHSRDYTQHNRLATNIIQNNVSIICKH